MAIASAYHPPLTTRQLLVSVQDADEAQVAAAAGVSWIDLKDPSSGALGRATAQVSGQVLATLKDFKRPVQLSAALGEWSEWAATQSPQRLPGFPILKLGLAGCGSALPQASQLDSLHQAALEADVQIVWALYADGRRAAAAEPGVVLQLARRFQSPYVLIDTWRKDGHSLFDWLSLHEVRQLKSQAADIGASLVVAGSLRTSDWHNLDQLGSVIIGIRGAVCRESDDRTTRLCPDRIAQWLEWH